MGTSLIVVGDASLLKVHIHTHEPGAVLSLATELGEMIKVKIDNMGVQHQAFRADRASPSPGPKPGTCAVAVVQGTGFHELFASLGSEVVPGGDTMNPSVEALCAAIERAPRSCVLLLPNHRNVVLAAEQAARLAKDRTAAVLPTTSLPQGIAALLAINPEADLEENFGPVEIAASRCHTIEITRAVRDVVIEDIAMKRGDPFAVVDGKIAASGPTYRDVVEVALGCLSRGALEVATIYVGSGGSSTEATVLAKTVEARLGLTAEVMSGGGQSYEYIISIDYA